MKKNYPIGVFDSGIGGLTVAKALVELLPHESLIYFGDTAHLPYGDKSPHAIQSYVKKIAGFLLDSSVKMMVVACNSASAAAYGMLQEYIGNQVLLLDVIEPMIMALKRYSGKSVGLIGTKLTVASSIYQHKLKQNKIQLDLRALATPLLVPIIEEGFSSHPLLDLALEEYLSAPELNGIEALVLACTHYPVIKDQISRFYHDKVEVLDASRITASAAKFLLAKNNLLASGPSKRDFYISDYTENFAQKAQLFFGKDVSIDERNIF